MYRDLETIFLLARLKKRANFQNLQFKNITCTNSKRRWKLRWSTSHDIVRNPIRDRSAVHNCLRSFFAKTEA